MEMKTERNTKRYENVNIGLVGYVPFEELATVKQTIEEIPGLNLIYFKISDRDLWIKEGKR